MDDTLIILESLSDKVKQIFENSSVSDKYLEAADEALDKVSSTNTSI